MKTTPQIPFATGLQNLPGWAFPALILLSLLAMAVVLPREVSFLAGLAAAIGSGVAVAEWRRSPDAPALAPSQGE